jgi:hypothetical protein
MTTPFLAGNLGLGTLSGLTLVEPTAAEYARQPVTFTRFPAGTGLLDAAADFGTTVTSWGTLSAWGLFDAAGNQVLAGPMTTPINGAAGQYVSVMLGAISIAFAPQASTAAGGLTLFGVFVGVGTNQASATPITAVTAIITSAPSGTGFVLPPLAAGAGLSIKNQDPTNYATIYPNLGAEINSFGVNNPISIAPGVALSFILTASNQWYA